MIFSMRGVLGGKDIGDLIDRDGFTIDASVGRRMDVARFSMFDPSGTINVPDRAECWIYDALPGTAVVDPPNAISAYNTYLNGPGHEVTSSSPSAWTPRLFAGFLATPEFRIVGPQRSVTMTAQDYTVRLRTTICNKAFLSGQTDKAIVQSLFATYRPDYDTTNVIQVTPQMPAISFPIHSLEQMMERVIKISRAIYRVDYYKRLLYGIMGTLPAPFNISDVPNFSTTFPSEDMVWSPDGSGLANKVWIVGSTFLSGIQTYQIPTVLVNGANYQFQLPGNPESGGMIVKIGGVDQGTIGVAPSDGDTTNPSGFKYNVLISHTPAAIAFKTPPPNASTVLITGRFRYPLVSAVSSAAAIAATAGQVFETVIRDRRIQDLALAQAIGNSFLQNQGTAFKGGSFKTKWRGLGGNLLQPGQQITIKNDDLFAGLLPGGSTTLTALITRMRTVLENDVSQPYVVEVSFSERLIGGGY